LTNKLISNQFISRWDAATFGRALLPCR